MNRLQIRKSKKIKPTVLRALLINSLSTYRDFFKKGYNKIKILNFKCPEKAVHSAKQDDFITQRRLFFLMKKLKFFKTFALKECDIRTKYTDFSKSKFMAKRMSHTKTLTFTAMRSVKAHPSSFIEKWLRFTSGVHNIDYKLLLEDPYLTHMKSQKPQTCRFPLITLKNHKVKSIQIELPLFLLPLADTFWQFQFYPSSLRRLCINGGIFNENLTPTLSLLKNLESVWFSFGTMTSVHFVSNIILQLKNLPMLEETRLNFSNNKSHTEIVSALKSLFSEKVLRKIELCFTNQQIDNIEGVFDTIQGHKLKLFKLHIFLSKDKQFDALRNLLNTTTEHLENLQFNLHLLQKCKTAKCLELICSQINQMKTLKHLKFSFRLAPNNSNTKSHPELKPIFLKLFQNRISLETLSFSSNISSPKLFISLVQLIKTNFLSLKKLKINTIDQVLQENEKKEFLQVIQSLHDIRVLKFPSLKVTSKDFLLKLAVSIHSLRYLRSLELGEMQKTITKSVLLEVVKRILSKRGLEKFIFPTHIELLLALQQSVGITETLNLDSIRHHNPHIITLPENPFIFDQNHFDRSW